MENDEKKIVMRLLQDYFNQYNELWKAIKFVPAVKKKLVPELNLKPA
ncbi:MAG: hypothetical protein WAV76_01980 [Bacteroidota bacterium]